MTMVKIAATLAVRGGGGTRVYSNFFVLSLETESNVAGNRSGDPDFSQSSRCVTTSGIPRSAVRLRAPGLRKTAHGSEHSDGLTVVKDGEGAETGVASVAWNPMVRFAYTRVALTSALRTLVHISSFAYTSRLSGQKTSFREHLLLDTAQERSLFGTLKHKQ